MDDQSRLSFAILETQAQNTAAGPAIEAGDGVIENNVEFRGKLAIGLTSTGPRMVITNQVLEVYDANNIRRVRLGLF